MLIREVNFEDYLKIKDLTNRNNIEIYDKFDWKKVWKENPYLKKNNIKWFLGWLIEDDKKNIVGHIGSLPTQYYYNSIPYNGAVMSCWIVDEKYRHYSMELMRRNIAQKNIDFSIVTSANSKTESALTAFGWRKIPVKKYNEKLHIILNLKKVIDSYLKKKSINTYGLINNIIFYLSYIIFFKRINYWKKFKIKKHVIVYNKFNRKFDNFWNKLKKFNKETFMFNRSSEWINWHLSHQFETNKAIIVAEEQNDEIIGYSICLLKNVDKINLKKAILLDLVALDDNDETYINLLLHSIKETDKQECHLFEIVGFNNKKRKIINSLKPFLNKGSSFPFYFKSNNTKLNAILLNEDSWDPSALDGDSIQL